MMGNFFKVTCPFLFQFDTVAFFPLIRGKHSFEAIAKIRDIAQIFMDAYSDASHAYIRPLKVWNRFSDTMFRLISEVSKPGQAETYGCR